MSNVSDSVVDRDELESDARTFARRLADAHPRPYLGHGGRVAFHRRLAELAEDIPAAGESLTAFHGRLQRFAARIGDGHTAVVPPEDEETPAGRLPVDPRVVGDGLHVKAVYAEHLEPLLGGRLLAVDGVPVADLLDRHASLASADNRYGHLKALGETLATDPDGVARLLDAEAVAPSLTVEPTDGERTTLDVTPTNREDPVASLERHLEHPDTDGQPAFRLLDGGRTALLRLPDSTSYREHHETMVALDRDGGGVSDSREAYRRIVGGPVPDDSAAVVAGLPSATDVLVDLAESMDDAATESLIVDVRGNGGGSSMLAYLLVLVLHGWDGLVTAAGDQYDVGKRSDLYREHYGDDGPLGAADTHAGYDLDTYFAADEAAAEEFREQVTSLSPTISEALDSGTLEGYAPPDDVVVVTDARTFSAGVEPAILLSKLGADVVGVPSGQSPNGPRDVLFDTLPNTGLTYRVSTRHHVFCPGQDGDVFAPDVPLTPERFRALDCAADAGVRLALAHLDGQVPGSKNT